MQLSTIDKIGIDGNRKREAGLLLREVREIDVFVQPSAYISRYAKFQGVFGNVLHFAAAQIFLSRLLARRKGCIVTEE